MEEVLKKLKQEWEENPTQMIVLGTLAAGALAKLINAVSAAQGRRAYAKSVNYRVKRNR